MSRLEVDRCLEALRKALDTAPKYGHVGLEAIFHDGKLVRLRNVFESMELAHPEESAVR